MAVVGPSQATSEQERAAERIGGALGATGVTVITGGLGGVMSAAARGARAAGGRTVGLLPGDDPSASNPWIEIVIPTGLGEARNALVVHAAKVVVVVGFGWGTLSEVALALRAGKPVVSLWGWAPAADGAQGRDGRDDWTNRTARTTGTELTAVTALAGSGPDSARARSPVLRAADADDAVRLALAALGEATDTTGS